MTKCIQCGGAKWGTFEQIDKLWGHFCPFLISKKLKISLHDPNWIKIRLNKWFYINKLTTFFVRDQIQRLISPQWRGETRLIKNHQILSSSKNDCTQSIIILIFWYFYIFEMISITTNTFLIKVVKFYQVGGAKRDGSHFLVCYS